jgi:hypothetical protein
MDSLQGSHSPKAIGFSAVRDSGAADAALTRCAQAPASLRYNLCTDVALTTMGCWCCAPCMQFDEASCKSLRLLCTCERF